MADNRPLTDGNFHHLYDPSGALLGCKTRVDDWGEATSKTYYYRRDALGNIIAVLDTNGNVVVEYKYNAWGSCIITNVSEEAISSDLGHKNPFRYRGYYYSDDLGLYYLKSRFYDPEVGRFISADTVDYLAPDTVNGLNLYAYCNNNPVMFCDPEGHAPKWWQSILLGAGIIVCAAFIVATTTFTGGGAAAFFAAAGSAALSGLKIAAVAGATAATIRASESVIEGENLQNVGKSFVLGFADGFFAGSVYSALSLASAGIAYQMFNHLDFGYGNGSGWKVFDETGSLLKQGLYVTPQTKGVVFIANQSGVNGGRSFSLDLDVAHGLHYHSNKFAFGSKKIKKHNWLPLPILIGIRAGFSDSWSEW